MSPLELKKTHIKVDEDMEYSDFFNSHRDEIMALPHNETINHGKIPVSVYVQEAKNLYIHCVEDKSILLSRGLDWEDMEALKTRLNLLSEAEAVWNDIHRRDTPMNLQLKEKALETKKLKRQLIHEFNLAFRKKPLVLKQIRIFSKSNHKSADIQCLDNFVLLAKKYTKELCAINFDFKLMDKAATCASELSGLIARNRASKKSPDAKVLRDKCYGLLKQKVDLVSRFARLCFYDDRNKQRAYASQYLRTRRLKQAARKRREKTAMKPSIQS